MNESGFLKIKLLIIPKSKLIKNLQILENLQILTSIKNYLKNFFKLIFQTG